MTPLGCPQCCQTRLLDSKASSTLSSSLQCQLASIYNPQELDKLTVEIAPVQQQIDCGLFAIAFATDLAHGNDPVKVQYDQQSMRQHLYSCLDAGKLVPFPHRSRFSRGLKTCSREFSVVMLYCVCKLPECYDDMVECDDCCFWYHYSCVNFDQSSAQGTGVEDLNWKCPQCVQTGKRRRCRQTWSIFILYF